VSLLASAIVAGAAVAAAAKCSSHGGCRHGAASADITSICCHPLVGPVEAHPMQLRRAQLSQHHSCESAPLRNCGQFTHSHMPAALSAQVCSTTQSLNEGRDFGTLLGVHPAQPASLRCGVWAFTGTSTRSTCNMNLNMPCHTRLSYVEQPRVSGVTACQRIQTRDARASWGWPSTAVVRVLLMPRASAAPWSSVAAVAQGKPGHSSNECIPRHTHRVWMPEALCRGAAHDTSTFRIHCRSGPQSAHSAAQRRMRKPRPCRRCKPSGAPASIVGIW
jgi:hypothetical protein